MAVFKVDSVTLKEKAFGGDSTESGVAGVPIAKRNSEDRLSPHFLTYTTEIMKEGDIRQMSPSLICGPNPLPMNQNAFLSALALQ